MVTLGSVLPPEVSGPRGLDLRVEVEVSRRELGSTEGVLLEIPEELEADDGSLHRRTPSPHDAPEGVCLRLPSDFPDGGVLRLRGQGAPGAAGRGDLWVRVNLTDDDVAQAPPPAPRGGPSWGWWLAVVAGVAGVAGVVAWVATTM